MNIVKNPKYAGCNSFYRNTQKMQTKRVLVEPQNWVSKEGAFPAIVDRNMFDRVQLAIPTRQDLFGSEAEIINRLRRLLRSKGYLSEGLILKTSGLPSASHATRIALSESPIANRIVFIKGLRKDLPEADFWKVVEDLLVP